MSTLSMIGFPSGISGADLTRRAITQARRFGVELLTAREATAIRLQDPYRIVQLADGSEMACHAIIIATGAGYQELDIPGMADFTGAGVRERLALAGRAQRPQENRHLECDRRRRS